MMLDPVPPLTDALDH